jgi:hypothetical protein
MCDIVSKWEEYKKVMASKGLATDFSIVFKKQLYLTPKQDPNDIIEYDLLFHQAIFCVLKGSWATDKPIGVALGALQFLYDRDEKETLPDEALAEIMYVIEVANLTSKGTIHSSPIILFTQRI